MGGKVTKYIIALVLSLSIFNFAIAAPVTNDCPSGSSTYTSGFLKGIPCDKPINDVATTVTVVKNIITGLILPLVAGVFSVIFIWGTILYITSNGNQQRTEQAKKTLTAAIVGLILIVLSEVMIGLFVRLLGGTLS